MSEPVRPSRPLEVTGLAVMPVTAELGSEPMSPAIDLELRRALGHRFPGLPMIGPEEARARLAASPAATEYAVLLTDFERTGVAESARLGRITAALGVSHLLQLRVSYVEEDFLDPYLWEEDLMKEERQVLVVVARVWPDEGSAPAWEAVARTQSETSEFGTERREPDELVHDLVEALVDRIPLSGEP